MGGMGMMGGFGRHQRGSITNDGEMTGELPEEFDGELPGEQAGGTFSGHPQGSEPALHDDSLEELEDGEEAVVTAKTLAEFDSPTWLWMGASVAVIIAGLAVAILFKRRS